MQHSEAQRHQFVPVRRLALVPNNNGTTPQDTQHLLTISFTVKEAHAPALRSAIEEISDAVATRTEGKFLTASEHALTCALIGLGQLRAALFPLVPKGDPNYRGRR